MIQFNEEETQKLGRNIKKMASQLKSELKMVEKNIRIYINERLLDEKDTLLSQIKENMSQNILTELNEFSKKFKVNQELYSKKCKELVSEEDDKILEMYDLSTNNSDFNNNENDVLNNNLEENKNPNFFMMEEHDELLLNREKELNEIVKGVNNLQELFKDLHVIVIEQGTILDRIDYNIDIGYTNVSKGKKTLENANENQKGSCFRNVILFLLFCIFIESMMILFKFL